MTKRIRTAALLFATMIATSCSDATGVESGRVRATALLGSIRVENARSEPIYTLILGRNQSALASYIACVESRCGEIGAGATVTVPDPNAALPLGSPREHEALLHWWVAVRDDDGNRVAGPITSVVVPLR